MPNEDKEWEIPAEDPQPNDAAEKYRDLPVEEQVAALLGDLEEAHKEASQNLDMAQRAQAELANFRRRTDEERISTSKFSNSRLLSKLLPVQEELDLAISHAGETGPNESWLEGVKLIQRKLLSLLESEGVAPIESMGVTFNPLEHEALGTEVTSDHSPGSIIQVLRRGYRLHDRVIQPAQVIVASEPQNENQSTDSPQNKETEHE